MYLAQYDPDGVTLEVGASPVPSNTAAPSISGTAELGGTLTCDPGSWSASPTGFTYQWYRDGAPIAGATGQTYVVQAADQGHSLSCVVIAANADGSSSPATSAAIQVPAAAPPAAPSNTTAPSISGTPAPGDALTCDPGSWSGSPTGFTYQWYRDGAPIAGSAGQTYVVQAADQGHVLTCTVVASGAGGSSPPATSAAEHVPAAAGAKAPACTLAAGSMVTVRHRRVRRHASVAGGTLPVRVTCDRAAAVKLVAVLIDRRAARRRGHTPGTKRYRLPVLKANVAPGVTRLLKLKLPASAVNELVHGAAESVTIGLTAVSPGGTGQASVRVSPLRT
jgi:hypothetical protein